MKVVILAGGVGTRLSEETVTRPKPMVEIGGRPILWHIMKLYSHYGLDDFVICLGYKGYMIKEWFANYYLHNSDVTINLKKNKIDVLQSNAEDWSITLVDTGETTQTGGRIKRVSKYLDSTFMLTYGDGVADINLKNLASFHAKHRALATVTAVQPPGRFGAIVLNNSLVEQFSEKPKGDGAWINGGFFTLEPGIMDYIKNGDNTTWEKEPLENLAADKQLHAFVHYGFWQPMDTLRNKVELDEMWKSNRAPWKIWV